MAFRIMVYLMAASSVTGFGTFQAKIPNGDKVPNPCKSGEIWNGVGHIAPGGKGERNDFGKAFKAQGESWTQDLCQADTDGDGKTNGEELGDPDCVWTKGGTPARTTDITHPAVCDDLSSDTCKTKNSWIVGDCDTSIASTNIVSSLLVVLSFVFYQFL